MVGVTVLADVIAMSGRLNSHWANFISVSVLDCCTEPHSIYEADGTCLCSCLGMDY